MDLRDTAEEAQFRSELRAWLDDVEAFWGDQLGAFKAHAEKTRGGPARAKRTQ